MRKELNADIAAELSMCKVKMLDLDMIKHYSRMNL